MGECPNCRTPLAIESVAYTKYTYDGNRKDGSHYHIEKLIPNCLVCGEQAVKFDKKYAKKE